MDDYSWTTGNESTLAHERVLGVGGFGDVHELRDLKTGQAFARKLVRPNHTFSMKDIQNEIRAVDKLCAPGTHKNIVAVLGHGQLPSMPYFYLDMELCDLDLETYNKSTWTERLRKRTETYPSEVQAALIATLGLLHIREIMKDITRGLTFIHLEGEVHRDLKPANVLYSSRNDTWKIADFGLTSEGTSKRARETYYSRGTPSYRSPELVKDGTFNNKSDIWALGCIFYELLVGSRAFLSDIAVHDYASKNSQTGDVISIPTDSEIMMANTRKFLCDLLLVMLKVMPGQRPSVFDLYQRFNALAASLPQPRPLIRADELASIRGNVAAPVTLDSEVLDLERLLGNWQINNTETEGESSDVQDSQDSGHLERKDTVISSTRGSTVDISANVAYFERVGDFQDTIYELGSLVQNKEAPWQGTWRDAALEQYLHTDGAGQRRKLVPDFVEPSSLARTTRIRNQTAFFDSTLHFVSARTWLEISAKNAGVRGLFKLKWRIAYMIVGIHWIPETAIGEAREKARQHVVGISVQMPVDAPFGVVKPRYVPAAVEYRKVEKSPHDGWRLSEDSSWKLVV